MPSKIIGHVDVYGLDSDNSNSLKGVLYLHQDHSITISPDTPLMRSILDSPAGYFRNRCTARSDPVKFMHNLGSYYRSYIRRATDFIPDNRDATPFPRGSDELNPEIDSGG